MNRFSDIDCSFKRLTPVYGFRSEQLVSIDKALEGLQSHIDQLAYYIKIAKQNCHYPSEHQLTRDESASIYIYTMEWGEQTLYRILNQALRNENRQALKIWFPYLKLFQTALEKLPTVKETLWRGVKENVGKNLIRDQIVTWWSINSCSSSVNVIKNFLGKNNQSTMFLIETKNGKQISHYTEYHNEEEVIVMMGTQFRVKGDPLHSSDGPDVVHLVEIDDDDDDDEEPTASAVENICLIITTALKCSSKSKSQQWKQQAITVAGGNGNGKQVNQLSDPYGISLDQNKTILIADYENDRIVRWECQANTGTIVAGGNGQGNQKDQLNRPTDVIVDKYNHSIIIADQGNRRVIRWWNQSQTNQQILIDNIDCSRLAMDKDGFLYVSDYMRHEVRRWKEGEREGTIVAGGNGEGDQLKQLSWPTSIFVDEHGSVYVSNRGNDRVMKWRQGAKEGVIVAGGNGDGGNLNQFSGPEGVLVDRWGQIYVVDQGNARVMRWHEGEREGEIVVGRNGRGRESNQLSGPNGLSLDAEGNLYVADRENHRIQKFDLIVD